MGNDCILYVEDDENDSLLLRDAFKKAGVGHTLHVVGDGLEAISYLTGAGPGGNGAENGIPCLVLLDLHLPVVSGLEVLEWIRAQPPLTTLPVIMFSSAASPREIARAYRLRANSFIIKPPDLSKLLEFARLLKSWWLEYNSFPGADGVDSRFSHLRADLPAELPALAQC
jgi:CheY-like chemotaxis protein